MHPSPLVVRISSFLAAITTAALAVPTAVNDTFTTAEDTPVAGGTVITPILVADFEPGGGNTLPLPALWDYTDTIPAGTTAYPTDEDGVSWRMPAFDKATSSIGTWKSAAMPLQGGTPGPNGGAVDGLPPPNILLGVTGNNAVNTVNTYLIRGQVTVTAAQAAQPGGWTASVLADDAAIIYINGTEAGRVGWDNFGGGTVNMDSVAGGQGSSETAFVNVPLTVPFVAGENTIAIELHQNATTSSDVGIGLSIVPSNSDPLQGLAYTDDVDGTTRPASASGGQDSSGNPNRSINVVLSRGFGGGGGGGSGPNTSGGWRKTIAVPTDGTLRIRCDARSRALLGLEDNEFAEAIVMLDGARLTYSGRNYLVRQVGVNPAGTPGFNGDADSGWASYTIETPVTAGNHVITFGAFGPRVSAENFDFDENGTVNFDNINVSLIGTGGSLLDNDTGGVAPVTAVKVTDPANGSVTVNPAGSFNYVPAANFFGTDTFTYKAVDGTGESAPATVTITVTAVNDAPVAVADGPYTTTQGQPLAVNVANGVLKNDTDVENAVLTAVPGTSTGGTVVLNTDGSFTFTPTAGFAGAATFTYRASDGAAQSALATVTINVLDEPDPPTASDDTYTAVKNTPLVVTATASGTTTETVFDQGATGWRYFNSIVLAERNQGTAWRTVDYVESAAQWPSGAAQLGYGNGDENTVIEDNTTSGYTAGAADRFATYYFRRTFEVPNVHTVTTATVEAIFDDTLSVFFNGTHVARTQGLINLGAPLDMAWDFYPGVQVNNNSTATWTLDRLVPQAGADALVEGTNLVACEVHQNSANSSDVSFDLRLRLTRAINAGVLANDADPDAGQTATLVAEVIAQPAHGTVTLNTNGTFTYTPATGYTGPDSFTYRARDTTDRISNTATANITVILGPNAAPVANPDSFTTSEDVPLNVDDAFDGVLGNDTDVENDPFAAVILAQPANGTLTLNANGTFLYTPAANFAGTDTFTYRAVDTKASAPATVTITVNPVNDVPVAVNDTYAGDPGVPFIIAAAQGVLANDTDADPGTTLTAELVAAPATGDLTLNTDGSFTFTAPVGGLYSFTYRAKDATSQSAVATVAIALNAVPVTNADAFSTDEDQPLARSAAQGVLANDNDPEGQPLTAQLAATVQHGTLNLAADGSFTYTPTANYHGADSFTYRASDGTRTSVVTTVTLTVNPVNDAPVALADTYGVRIDTPLVIAAAAGVLRNDTDVDNASLTAELIASPADGTLVLNPDGSFTYTPLTGFSGATTFTYRASDGTAQSSVVTVTLNVTADLNTVSISEIMYNPPGATGVQEEFIEIYNYGDAAVDLTGWEFTKGVNYLFPAGTLLAGKSFLAIPGNKAAFTAKYPAVTNVTSTGWGADSSLGNGGELIRLKNGVGEDVDEVEFSDQGDWAVRKLVNVWRATNTPGAAPPPVGTLGTNPGLEWVTAADPDPEIGNPGGSSIQLINFNLTNNAGANWTASPPTPGAANAAVAQTNSAPLIREVTHSPEVPNATQQVFVTARIQDEEPAGYTASLFYRTWTFNSSTADSATFTEVAMADNGLRNDGAAGDGVFGAVIPAQALNKVVEFYVRAADAQSNARTWPAPTLDLSGANPVQNANCLYQVNEEAWTDHRPLYQVIFTGADYNTFNAGKGDSQSNVAPNVTVIFRQGGSFAVRYLGGIRPRGNSSRGDTPINLRLDIPGDTPWNGRTAFTMNYKYSYSQFFASRLFEAAGVPCEKAGVVGMRLNGVNRLLDNNPQRTFGYYCDLLPRGGDTVNEWFPGDDDGNAYGKIRGSSPLGVVTQQATIGAGGYAVGGYINQGYTKQTNAAANDWTDLHAWLQDMNSSTAADFHTTVADTMDVDEWCRFLAIATIVNHAETNLANGDDDDNSYYFGALDRLCRIIPHDLDTCFNLNAIGLGDEVAPPTLTIYQCTEPNYPTDNAVIAQMDKFYRNPVTGRKFKAALRYYLDTIFAKPAFDATVDTLLDSQWLGSQNAVNGNANGGNAIRAHIKAFLDTRRATIEAFLPTAFTATTTLAVQNGYARSTAANDLGSLGGKIDPARTAKVTVNGIQVTTNPYGSTAAADNSWSAGTAVTLKPGLNTLVCTAWDENDVAFASQTVSIWYDATGTDKSGALAASETWTAAGGPYNVTASLSVPNSVTLTIEPGATVFVAPGADITVAAGGRILAVGTAASGITIARNPGGTGNWGGITISGASVLPTVMSYVTFDNNGDVAIHAQNGASVELDHLTFKNAGAPFLSLDASSFLVRDCIFPATPAGTFEPVHGSGGIAAGGRGIIQDCWFGKTSGYQDTIDFTGGNRPGPILHVLRCVFEGSDDDILDLDSTDAWVEGNVFLHAHRNGASPDSASAVSGGSDNNEPSQITVINNLIYDCDNAVTLKAGPSPRPGGSGVLLYNTIVRITKAGGIDGGSGVVNYDDDNVDGEGKGFYLEGNIIQGVENLTRNWVPANSALILTNNWLPAAPPAEATSSGNFTGDPLLNLALIPNPATATAAQVRAALTLQPCSPALGLGADQNLANRSIRVQTPPGIVWPASVTLNVGPGGSFTPTGQSAWDFGFTHYKYRLDGGADSAEIPVATPLLLSGLALGNHTLSITVKDDSGQWVDGGRSFAFYVAPAAPSVVLSEVLAAPATGNEFIELHNYGTAVANVAGCSLFTDDGLPTMFTFPDGASIPAGGRLIVDATQLGFNLNRSGETIRLICASGSELDAITFGPQITGMSIARIGTEWALSTPAPAAANTSVCELGTGSLVRINEWLGSNDLIVDSDFVELYNGEAKPVSIAGWSVSEDYRNDPAQNLFPPLSFIPAGGFLELIADGNRAAGGDHLSFKVSRLRDAMALLTPAGALADVVHVLPGNPDISQGRTPDGAVATTYLALPTPGFSNGSNLTADTAVRNALRITEIMFDSPSNGPEYIEFKNTGATPLSITGVSFAGGVTWSFPDTTVAAGGYAVITNSLVAFNARYPGVQAVQWTGGRLDNNGESIRIETGTYGLGILDFRYEGDWYPDTRTGASLEIIDPAAAVSTWSLKTSWQPCLPSPGGPSAFGVAAPADVTATVGDTVILNGFLCPGAFPVAGITLTWSKVSGPGTVNFTAAANKTTDATFTLPGTYEIRFTATPPGAPDSSDSLIVTVFDTYAAWTARTLSGFPADQRAPGADADKDGVPNAVEHVLGTDPAAPGGGPEVIVSNGFLALRYSVSKLADPAIQIIPQISDALGSWLDGPAVINDTYTESADFFLHIAEDTAPLGASGKKFMRLKVVVPQP